MMRSNEYQLLLARLLVFSSINLMRLSAGLVQTFIYPMINAMKYGRAEKQRRKTQQEAGKTNFTAVLMTKGKCGSDVFVSSCQ